MELRHYLNVLRKRWIMISATTIVFAIIGFGYSLTQTPLYDSTARVLVSIRASDSVVELQQGNTFSQQKVKTYADLATTQIVLAPVIAQLGLDTTVDRLAKNVTASAPTSTTLVDITATAQSPGMAADIANAVSDSLAAVVARVESDGNASGASLVVVTPIQDAEQPTKPVSPNIPLTVVLAALAGLVVGYLGALARASLDKRIHGRDDVARITTAPVVGMLPFNPDSKAHPLVVSENSGGVSAEAFRTLRTNLRFLGLSSTKRIYVVTSARMGDGKSTSAANLALAVADSGERTLLIDADLRSPSLAGYLGIPGAVGLTDLLIGSAEAEDLIQPWGTGELSVLAAGQIPPNPSELIGSPQMAALLEHLAGDYDAIIIDTPPLLPVSDAAVLSRLASATIVVAAVGQTHLNDVREAVQMLSTIGTTVSGIVLSKVPTKGASAYGYGVYGATPYGAGATVAQV